jgi:hypothetical protein
MIPESPALGLAPQVDIGAWKKIILDHSPKAG